MGEFDKHIEDLIRQKFENFAPEPPENVWEQIKPRIAGPVPPSPGGNLIFPILTFLGVILFVVSLIFNDNTIKPVSLVQAETSALSPENNEIPEAVEITIARLQSTTYVENNLSEPSEEQGNAQVDEKIAESTNNKARNPLSQGRKFRKDNRSSFYSTTEQTSQRETLARMNNQGISEIDYSVINPIFLNERKVASRHIDDYARSAENWWSAGLSFMPEMIFNPDQDTRTSQLIQADLNYHFSNIYLQSGIGVKFNSDQGAYQIDYNKYLGSYDYVYDVTFDSIEGAVVPTYHTYLVDVFDTLVRYQVSETDIRYTYLDVPLALGYWKNLGRVSLFAQGGVNFSFQVGKKAVNIDYPDDRSMILNVDQASPVRVMTNIQLLGSFGVDYKITRNISFSAEPVFRYYLGAEYESSEMGSQPYGLGFKAGMRYNFFKR